MTYQHSFYDFDFRMLVAPFVHDGPISEKILQERNTNVLTEFYSISLCGFYIKIAHPN